jgi:hypothetical protein
VLVTPGAHRHAGHRDLVDERCRGRRALLLADVADTFNDDLARKGSPIIFDLARVDDLSLKAELASVYPEATPVGALPSVFAYA